MTPVSAAVAAMVERSPGPTRYSRPASGRLVAGFTALERLPVLKEARTRLVRELSVAHPSGDRLAGIIESDIGLAVATLRLANGVELGQRGKIASVPRALDVLTHEDLVALGQRVAVVSFFEQLDAWEVAPDWLRRHSVATQQVVDQLTEYADGEARAELSVAALLHDVGKLALGVAYTGYAELGTGAGATPCERVRLEREACGIDHALVGGVLIRRWGLPDRLADIVSAHHAPKATGPAATLQLADLLVHYGQESKVSGGEILAAATNAGIDESRVRGLMLDLATRTGLRRPRSSVASPLTKGERTALRGISRGQVVKEIALERGVTASTVRSLVHTACGKLGTTDRAQAVLVAEKSGWV